MRYGETSLPATIGYATLLADIFIKNSDYGIFPQSPGLASKITNALNIRTVGELLELNVPGESAEKRLRSDVALGAGAVEFIKKRLSCYGLELHQTYEDQLGSKEEVCTLGQARHALQESAKGLAKTEIDDDDPMDIGDKRLRGGTIYHLGNMHLAREFSTRIKELIAANMKADDYYMPSIIKSAEIPHGVFVPRAVIDQCPEIDGLAKEFATKAAALSKGSVLRK